MLLQFILRRFIYMLIIMLAVSVIGFVIIQLPPGDYLSVYVERLKMAGYEIDQAQLAALKARYGLDQPAAVQYLKWMWGMFHGDFGQSFEWNRPVFDLVMERLPLTMVLSIATMILTYVFAIPIGIYSATHQYSPGDFLATVFGFAGLAIPNFLFALILMWVLYSAFGLSIGGLFSQEYLQVPWSWGKAVDLLKHLPVPLIVIGTSGAAGLIRVMRGCLLDELRKQYVVTARAKGVSESKLLFKYPVRIALNPIISTVGWALPAIVGGETIVAIVLNLPTTGPLLYRALISQDMYLAGSTVLFLTFMTVVGILISDILLAVMDPRIRYEK
jgi:peptide/nickel transport system permease protein